MEIISKGKTVILGMSGGIDSTYAAYLLKKEGYNIIGITFKLYNGASRCCDVKDVMNARKVATQLGIKHYIIDLEEEFKKKVYEYFIKEYTKARTPNPCVVCNEEIKFKYMFEKMIKFGFDFISTGHYVRLHDWDKGIVLLKKAIDEKKTQEYFLARVDQEYLNKAIFPLGELKKEDIKKEVGRLGFEIRETESEELCFIPEGKKYHEVLIEELNKRGIDLNRFGYRMVYKDIVFKNNEVFFKYTIGQRRGLGVGYHKPLYVVKIDTKKREIILGDKQDIYSSTFYTVKNKTFLDLENFKRLYVKIRYNTKEVEVDRIIKEKNKFKVILKNPISAITPGQLAVFYNEENIVIGSGWIYEGFGKN